MTLHVDLNAVKSVNPSARPQFPFDKPPRTPESSLPTHTIWPETDIFISMRDGIKLAADVFRPSAPGERFPALVAVSPYSRQLQRTSLPESQHEAGITEFWVSRGYAHVVADVRGSNDSEGSWDHMGPREQQDLFDLIEWVGQQPWCNGNVGMIGCSYFGWSQLMAAAQQPPHLKAIFPFDAATDAYRELYYHGGILCPRRYWFDCMWSLNMRGDRVKDPSGLVRHIKGILADEHPLNDSYHQDRLSWPRLASVNIPVYFGCDWAMNILHLRGAFEGWQAVGDVPKRMLIGPRETPPRPFAAYHQEALRWYDYHLKGMDTRVMEGPPIQLYIPGRETWRGEREWPLARTQWREFFLAGGAQEAGGKLADSPGADSFAAYDYDPLSHAARLGGPKLVYRSGPLVDDLEVTGPLSLYLWASSTAADTDWFVTFRDEAPGGQARTLTRGWLRASHRELDNVHSTPWRPFHPHNKADPLIPKQAYEFAIEIWPTSNVFKAGHRLRLEIASCDDQTEMSGSHEARALIARNTILEGRSHPSRLLVPVIPSE